MGFDFSKAIARVHRIVHDTMSFDALYYDRTMAVPQEVRVRWHYKQAPVGDLETQGYPLYLDLVEQVFFDKEELALKGIVPQRGGRVQITSQGFTGCLSLDVENDDNVGPVGEAWKVGKWHGDLTS